jgi:hypothetical protein
VKFVFSAEIPRPVSIVAGEFHEDSVDDGDLCFAEPKLLSQSHEIALAIEQQGRLHRHLCHAL